MIMNLIVNMFLGNHYHRKVSRKRRRLFTWSTEKAFHYFEIKQGIFQVYIDHYRPPDSHNFLAYLIYRNHED